MLSPSTLERVSVSYRKGYYDGYEGKPKFIAVKPEYIKPFSDFDYESGYEAGANDRRWSDERSQNIGCSVPATIEDALGYN